MVDGGFSPSWFSHKFNGPGVRYEICVSIVGGDIVWINGPFRCGAWPDLRIAREKLVHNLSRGEKIIADGGYQGEDCFDTPNGLNNQRSKMVSNIRARHETINGKIKAFRVVSNESTFRHELKNHQMCFYAVANIANLELSINKIYNVHYDENLFMSE